MSEEIRNNKALDDAALEDVGGGIDPGAAAAAARYACQHCAFNGPLCQNGMAKLAAYMLEHNVRIYSDSACPFHAAVDNRR